LVLKMSVFAAPLAVSCRSVRVLTSSGQLGVPKVHKPAPTEPRPFALRSDSRARVRKSHDHPSMEQAAAAAGGFKAQPLKKSILDGPVSSAWQQLGRASSA
jgi:hypothetical protein